MKTAFSNTHKSKIAFWWRGHPLPNQLTHAVAASQPMDSTCLFFAPPPVEKLDPPLFSLSLHCKDCDHFQSSCRYLPSNTCICDDDIILKQISMLNHRPQGSQKWLYTFFNEDFFFLNFRLYMYLSNSQTIISVLIIAL